jgi:hypothetical protein
VRFLELVPDLGLGLAADLLADPLPVRVESERDHAAPAPSTGLVVGAVLAVFPVIEVDAVFAVAATPSIQLYTKRAAWLPQWLPRKTAAT